MSAGRLIDLPLPLKGEVEGDSRQIGLPYPPPYRTFGASLRCPVLTLRSWPAAFTAYLRRPAVPRWHGASSCCVRVPHLRWALPPPASLAPLSGGLRVRCNRRIRRTKSHEGFQQRTFTVLSGKHESPARRAGLSLPR